MSHRFVFDCSAGHAMTGWGTAERINEAGERCFVWERHCCSCGLIEEARGAIIEPDPRDYQYAKVLDVREGPDD